MNPFALDQRLACSLSHSENALDGDNYALGGTRTCNGAPMARAQESGTLLSVLDAIWAEAARRKTVLRPLSEQARLGWHAVKAARDLNLGAPRVYDLLPAF
jgi:hypothetical protein